MPPQLTRLVYKSLIQASAGGARPECLPMARGSRSLPTKKDMVHRNLKAHFLEADSPECADPFAVVRTSSDLARALWPETLPAELPAFVLPGHTLLPGERAQFVFFEPRYRQLCERVMSERDGQPADRRFLHLPARRAQIKSPVAPVGTVITILQHAALDDGRHAVVVIAGPRVEVTGEREEPVEGGGALTHASFVAYEDSPPADADRARETVGRCVASLTSLPAVKEKGIWEACVGRSVDGLEYHPPVLNPERFGLWLCATLLPPDDARQRMAMLFHRDSTERLQFALEVLDSAHARAGGKE